MRFALLCAFVGLTFSASAAPPIEALQRSVQQRWGMLYQNRAVYVAQGTSGKERVFPARSDGTPAPEMPPDGFYGADLDNPTRLYALVLDLQSAVSTMATQYYAPEFEMEGTSIGVQANREWNQTFSENAKVSKWLLVPPSGTLEQRLDYIKTGLRAMKVAWVFTSGDAGYSADKVARNDPIVTPQHVPGVCGDADASAVQNWHSTVWNPIGYFGHPSGYNLAFCVVSRELLPHNPPNTKTTTSFRNRRARLVHELTPYVNARVKFYVRLGKWAATDEEIAVNPPVLVDEKWQVLSETVTSGRAISRSMGEQMAQGGPVCVLNKYYDYSWFLLSACARVEGNFIDEWEDSCAPCADGCSGASLGSINWNTSLGQDLFGRSSAQALLQAEQPFAGLCTPQNLKLQLGRSAQRILGTDGELKQLLLPTSIVNFVPLTSFSYEMREYPRTALGAQQPDGTYAVTGNPHRTIFIGNAVDEFDAPIYDIVEIIETKDGNPSATTYQYNPTTGTWLLSTGSGLRQETLTRAWNVAQTERTETRVIRNIDNQVTAERSVVFKVVPWGEVRIREILDPNGAALTTTWDYYTDPAVPSKYTRLKSRVDPSGYWETYDYDAAGRLNKKVAQVGNQAFASAENLNRVTTITHNTANPEIAVVESYQGVEVKRSYRAQFLNETQDIVCTKPGAAWNDATNLVTKTFTVSGTEFNGRLQSVVRPDGSATIYSYSRNAGAGTETTVTATGQPNVGRTAILSGTIVSRTVDLGGNLVSETETDAASGLVVTSRTASAVDGFGHPTTITFEDGTTESEVEGCCGPASQTDRQSVATSFGYDDLGRTTSEQRGGVTHLTAYDPDGKTTALVRKGSDDSEITLSTTSYDLAGRATESTALPANDQGPRLATTIAYSVDGNGHSVETTTHPWGGTQVQTFAQDRRLISVTGSAAAPVRYEYGTADISRGGVNIRCTFAKEIRLDALGADTAEWKTEYTDMAGRTVRIVSPREAAVGGTAVTDTFFNTLGQVSKTIDADGVGRLYAYNAAGEQQIEAADVNQNGAIDYSGADRIVKSEQTAVQRNGWVVRRTSTSVWLANGANTPTLVSQEDAAAGGLRLWSTQSGLETATVVAVGGAGAVQTTVTGPDGSSAVTESLDGRTTSAVRSAPGFSDPILSVSMEYDPHGRLAREIDSRNGATDYTYFANDALASVTTPAPDAQNPRQVTSYTYHANGSKLTETLPDAATVQYDYWATGALKKQWGARTYPVEYGYDAQGRLTTLTTWRDYATSAGAAVTTWLYDAASGRLKKKEYADSQGPSYTYTAAGRLESRT